MKKVGLFYPAIKPAKNLLFSPVPQSKFRDRLLIWID